MKPPPAKKSQFKKLSPGNKNKNTKGKDFLGFGGDPFKDKKIGEEAKEKPKMPYVDGNTSPRRQILETTPVTITTSQLDVDPPKWNEKKKPQLKSEKQDSTSILRLLKQKSLRIQTEFSDDSENISDSSSSVESLVVHAACVQKK